jgi:hypothetical protein
MSLTTKQIVKFNRIANNWLEGDGVTSVKQVRALSKLDLMGLAFRSTEWVPHLGRRLPLDNFFLFIEDVLSGFSKPPIG